MSNKSFERRCNIVRKSIINEPEQVRTEIAVSPQETAIAPNLTVRENLELMAGVHGFNKERNKDYNR